MKNYLPFLLLVITVLSASCSSPLDEDTPRRRTASSNDTPHPPIAAIQVTPSFSLNGGNTVTNPFKWDASVNGTNGSDPVLIDTLTSAPAVWINATLQGTTNNSWNNGGNNVVVKSLVLHADSLVLGTPGGVAFNSAPEAGTGARIVLEEQIRPPGTVPQMQTRTIEVNGTVQTGLIKKVEHDPIAGTFTVTIAIDNIPVRVGTMDIGGTLTIRYR
jgi:hypothetical protein